MKPLKILTSRKKPITAKYVLLWVLIAVVIAVIGYAIFTAGEVGLIGQ